MAQRETLKTSWVYSLRKEELVSYLVQCSQDPSGTVDEMRKRLVKFITGEHEERITDQLLEWQKQYEQNSSGSPSISLRVPGEKNEWVKLPNVAETTQSSHCESPIKTPGVEPLITPSREDRVNTIELVRKWGLKYDGGKEVLKFVDRLEELAAMYEINLNSVVSVMCELLKDRALIWFRNNHKSWEQWFQFKKDLLGFFLPQRYFEKLEEEIRSRTQRPRENFKEYVLVLQDLMYHAKLSAEEKLEIIFRNSLPDYQWYIRRRDFQSLDDLMSLAAELESIPTSRHSGRNEHHRMLKDRQISITGSDVPHQQRTCLTWEDEKIKATIIINHRPSTAIVDTGATRSFIMPSFVKQMRQRPEYLSTDIEVALADGSKKKISHAIQVPVTFGNISKKHEFLIMEDATEAIILGLDFLRAVNTTINCAGLNAKCRAVDDDEVKSAGPQTKVREPITLNISNRPRLVRASTSKTPQDCMHTFLEEELGKFQLIQGLSTAATHRIVMKDDRPIKIRYAPRNPAMQAIIDEEVNSLLARGCIEPSRSPYSFPITLVKKKNGTWRTCMDFRQLNARSVPDAYPLPRIDTILDRLRNAKYISSLDLKDGYWQIPMDEESKKYTAFAVTGRGLYQWRVMPFGLHSAPATFQRALDSVIGPDMEPHAFAYLDDIIVIGKTFKEHMDNLREVFRRLRAANLRINADKCEFFKSETRYLGHTVTSEGIKTDPEKIAAIAQLPRPEDTKGIRRFLGVTSWYRRFVPNFARLSQPLTQLLKKGKHWRWGPEQQEAFEALKDCLTKAPVLACPDFSKPFTLQTDASDCGLGAVLTQDIDGAEHVIAYASRHLNGAEKNYSATEKECLAIVWGVRKMRPYLEGYEFQVITDHLSLKWLNSIDNPSGRLARWALELQQYKFTVNYRKGKQNIVADALSRHPIAEINFVQTRPSRSCPWYDAKLEAVRKCPEQHADYSIIDHKLYRHFSREVNEEDATPWKLCVPTYQRQQVLMENHDTVPGGHMGVRKTLNKVASRYYWPGMARDIGRYVRQCDTCQRYKVSQQPPAGKMLSRTPDEPWSLVCADFIGPLPRTPHGNTMILVLFDNFSKWVELIPLRKATAEGVVKALRERIVARYGVPKALVTDNGTQFTSRIVKRYLEEAGIKQQFTAPYTPQENPTERANRTIKTMIAQFSGVRHNHWDELLPEVMLAVNTSVSESTGYSPAFLTQGRNPRLPRALYDEVTIGTGARCVGPEERANELKDIFKIVRRNLEQASQKQRHYYNLRRRNWTPVIGDRVLVRQHPLSKAVDNFAAKLAEKFKGPYIVTGFVSPVIVELRAVENSEKRTAHISELKSYYPNNQLFSILPSRSTKPVRRRSIDTMEAEREKFEKSREKFRRNLTQQQENRRRTIFLSDEEVPETSQSRPRNRRRRTNSRGNRNTPQAHASKSTPSGNTKKAQHLRMVVVSPVRHHAANSSTHDLETSAITISDDDEVAPPPPPLGCISPTQGEQVTTTEEDIPPIQTPSPPGWSEEGLCIDDLDIDPEYLNDPLIQEYCRTFWGESDRTMDVRPPTPPSPQPPSSSSSLDWESENFRPPTPPRRQGYGSVDVTDRQYSYLGMRCYERTWRARILLPGRATTPALTSSRPLGTRPREEKSPNRTPMSSPSRRISREPALPVTPGRGWLHSSSEAYEGTPHFSRKTDSASNGSPEESSAPPPPIITGHHSPIPSPPPIPKPSKIINPLFEQLPEEIQRDILKRREELQVKRPRFTHEIWGHRYRVTFNRNGMIRLFLSATNNPTEEGE